MKDFFYKNANVLVVGGLAAVALIFAVLFFSSLGDDDEKATQTPNIPSQTEDSDGRGQPGWASPPPSDTPSDMESVFLQVVNNEYPETVGSDEELLAAGYRVCEDMSAGATVEDFTEDALRDGIDPGMYGFIVGAASETLCPENSGFFMEESGSNA